MSCDNLLIGNGLNMAIDYPAFCATSIEKRFYEVLIKTCPLYEALFGFAITADLCAYISAHNQDKNIEQLADDLFGIVKAFCLKSGAFDSANLTERINATIKISALNAIFFNGATPILLTLPAKEEHVFDRYKQVFTLNYFEFWDQAQTRCTYLHGKIPADILSDKAGEVILYDNMRFHASQASKNVAEQKYAEAVVSFGKRSLTVPILERPIIFSPVQVKKNKMANATAYPGETLFPAWDLFPKEGITLYKELIGVDELAVFGVSPYGDDLLIDDLRQIPTIHIFIHDLCSDKGQAEKELWELKLPGNDILFLDAKEFWI